MANYEVGKRIGHGTYGECHAAIDKRNNRLYCLKRIENAAAGLEEQEATVLRTLDHPGIVRYHDSFILEEEAALCVVMEFCDGGDLSSIIRQRARSGEHFSEDEVLDMFVQLIESLKYLHGRRILHRDLKPQNVLVSSSYAESPRLLLADFGIAKVLDAADSAAATVLGTPTYLSPEICKGQKYSYSADVWALGCILHELIALKPAWATNNLLAAVYKICEKEPPPLPHCPGVYSYELQCLVDEMLSKEPSERPTLDEILRRPLIRSAADRVAARQREPSYGFTRSTLSDETPSGGRSGDTIGEVDQGQQAVAYGESPRLLDIDSGGESGGERADGE